MSNLQAIGRWVFVQLDPPVNKSNGGIFLAEEYVPKECSGVAVSVGRGTYNRRGQFVDHPVKKGDRVAFKWFNAQRGDREVKWNGETFYALRDDEILGIVEGNGTIPVRMIEDTR